VEQTFEEAQAGAPRPILASGEPLSDAIYDALGPPYELDGQTAGGDGAVELEPATEFWDQRSLSVAAFGRDITDLGWDQLTAEEREAIKRMAQCSTFPASLRRFLPDLLREEQDAPRPQLVVNNADWGPGRGEVVIPAGHQNRKARRAAKAQKRRDAWHAFKAGRRAGLVDPLALKALADPRWLADQILAQEERHRRSGGGT
jgi:hypothetical protein